MAHMEMIAAILYQLTKNLTPEEIKRSGFDTYFVDHTAGVYPVSAAGVPFTAAYFAVKGDLFADLHEDLAAEQKARVTYDNILRLVDDPDVRDPIKFLREREIVHYQRFGEPKPTNRNRSYMFCCKAIHLKKNKKLCTSKRKNGKINKIGFLWAVFSLL